MKYEIDKQEHEDNAYFTVRWSPVAKADKYRINASVPAMGGIAELYYMDDHGKLVLYYIARSWYGGLRAALREMTDAVIERDDHRRSVLAAHEDKIYYRYSCTESYRDMNDILFFFLETYSPGIGAVEHSGRYDRIFVKEIDADKLTTV